MAKRATPSFQMSPPALVERFAAVLADYPNAQRRKMFGYPAAFVGGNMATGLFAATWVVRLPAADIEPAKAAGAASFEPMPGRPMKAFVVIPAADVDDDTALRWLGRARPCLRGVDAADGMTNRSRGRYLSFVAISAAIAASDVSITIT